MGVALNISVEGALGVLVETMHEALFTNLKYSVNE